MGVAQRLLPSYRRSSPEVEKAVVGIYLSGGNTRRIRTVLAPLVNGAPLSKSAVSRLVSRLQGDYERWRQLDLGDDRIVHLYLDAIYPKVRSGGKVVALPVLVGLGVKINCKKALLALATGGAESGAAGRYCWKTWQRGTWGGRGSSSETATRG